MAGLKLEYIVTGTGRCGTLFMANFLTSAGIPCTHEAVFTTMGLHHAMGVAMGTEKAISSKVSKGDNLSDYEMDIVGESSYMSAPLLSYFQESKVIHVVRNPLKVISSFLGLGYFTNSFPCNTEFVSSDDTPEETLRKEYVNDTSKYETFIYQNLPELTEEMPQLDRACLYWTGWNEMIEASGLVSYSHRLEDGTAGLSKFIGSEGTYSKVSNASVEPGPKWQISQIQNEAIKKRLKDLAKKYGYFSIV